MIKIIITIGILLSTVAVPWLTNDRFNPGIWAATVARNHRAISDCFGYIEDNQINKFKQACNISTLIVIENSIIKEFHEQHSKYPTLSRHEFLSLHYSPKTAIMLSSHFDHQHYFNMTLMVLIIAEAVINTQNTED